MILRARAQAIRAEIARKQAALDAQREADLAGQLDERADELDRELFAVARAAELRSQADTAEQQANDLDNQAKRFDQDIAEAEGRLDRSRNAAAELATHQTALEQQAAGAAESGDTEAILEAERELSLLPLALERLRAQVEASEPNVETLKQNADDAETKAHELRESARRLRRWADVDPLAESEPGPTDEEQAAEARKAIRALQEFFDDPKVGELVYLSGKVRSRERLTEAERHRFEELTRKERPE